MKVVVKAGLLTVLGVLLTVMVYLFRLGGNSFVFTTDIMAVVFSFIAVFLGVNALKMHKTKSLHGKSIFLITLGIFMWFLGEFFWLLLSTKVWILLEILRFAGYIPLTIGFLYVLKVSDPRFRGEKKILGIILIVFLAFAVLYLNVLPVAFGVQSIVKSIFTNGYIVADFTLLFGMVLLLRVSHSFRGGGMSRLWLIFAAAFFLIFLFDLNFAFNFAQYKMGDLSEILWLSNYILVAFGFFYNSYIFKSIQEIVFSKVKK
jgi:hypothetical protein